MKKISFLAFIFTLIAIVACSSEEKVTEMNSVRQIPDHAYDIAWNNAKCLGCSPLLFTYNTVQEAANTRAVIDLAISSRADISSVPGATKIVHIINVSNGRGILTQYHFVNERTNTILRSYILNPNTGQYQINSTEPVIGNPLQGDCPNGYSTIAFCANSLSNEAFGNCMGQGQQGFANLTLTGVGSCMELRVSVTSTGMLMCGRSC